MTRREKASRPKRPTKRAWHLTEKGWRKVHEHGKIRQAEGVLLCIENLGPWARKQATQEELL